MAEKDTTVSQSLLRRAHLVLISTNEVLDLWLIVSLSLIAFPFTAWLILWLLFHIFTGRGLIMLHGPQYEDRLEPMLQNQTLPRNESASLMVRYLRLTDEVEFVLSATLSHFGYQILEHHLDPSLETFRADFVRAFSLYWRYWIRKTWFVIFLPRISVLKLLWEIIRHSVRFASKALIVLRMAVFDLWLYLIKAVLGRVVDAIRTTWRDTAILVREYPLSVYIFFLIASLIIPFVVIVYLFFSPFIMWILIAAVICYYPFKHVLFNPRYGIEDHGNDTRHPRGYRQQRQHDGYYNPDPTHHHHPHHHPHHGNLNQNARVPQARRPEDLVDPGSLRAAGGTPMGEYLMRQQQQQQQQQQQRERTGTDRYDLRDPQAWSQYGQADFSDSDSEEEETPRGNNNNTNTNTNTKNTIDPDLERELRRKRLKLSRS